MTPTRWRSTLCAAAAAVLWSSLPGAAVAGAIEQLKAFSTATQSARGAFTQQTQRTRGRAAETASGSFAFQRPGRFRWEVSQPDEQLIVADGTRVHFFDKELKQVTVSRMDDAIGATPAALLFGASDLEARFTLKESGAAEGLEWLEATPRQKESGFDRIRIGLRAGLPEVMEVQDAFGQTTRFGFQRLERNPTLDPALFRFTPPPGVDVVQ